MAVLLCLFLLLTGCANRYVGISREQTDVYSSGEIMSESVWTGDVVYIDGNTPKTRPLYEETPVVIEEVFYPASAPIIAPEPIIKRRAVSEPARAMAINFVNADVRDVVKSVIGDTLGMKYTIAPGLRSKVTVKINKTLPKAAILPALDTVLRLHGAAMVASGDTVHVVPVSDAPKNSDTLKSLVRSRSKPGYGHQIVPLLFINADEIARVLEPVSPKGGVTLVNSSYNILVLSGSDVEREAMMDVVTTFDVDWLAQKSIALYPIKSANASDVRAELWEVLGTSSGPLSRVVQIVSLDRLNALLVISLQPRYLEEIKPWVVRFDVSPNGGVLRQKSVELGYGMHRPS